jgi:hypothetical protein
MVDESELRFWKLRAQPYIIPDYLARELAAIVIEWGGLENAITADLEAMRMWPIACALSDAIPGGFGARVKLWRRSVAALYPTIKSYNEIATKIAEKAHTLAIYRHRLIHGLWLPDEAESGSFSVLTPLDRLRKEPVGSFKADIKYLAAVHTDIKTISAEIWGFTLSRSVHAAGGQLQLQPEPSGERPALPIPPTPEKP